MYKVNLMDMEIGVSKETTVYDLVKKYSQEDYDINNIIACKVNGVVKSLNHKIKQDCDIKYIFTNSTEGMRIYVRGLTLVLIKALQDTYPGASADFPESQINNFPRLFLLFLRKQAI